MVNNHKFKISGETFSGFTTEVDLDEVDNLEQIINVVINKLRDVITKHNFVILINQLDKCNFHTHGYTFEDVLLSEPDNIFFICNHDI